MARSAILDTSNNVTDLLDVPNDLNYEPFKYIENNNYFMCDGIDPDSNIHNVANTKLTKYKFILNK